MSMEQIEAIDEYKFSETVFYRFNPLTCMSENLPIPKGHEWFVYSIILRARSVLTNRTLGEIKYAADTLDYIESKARHEMSMESFEYLKKTGASEAVSSVAMTYYNYIPLFDISDQDYFKNATWHEYFAVLALTRIGMVINTFNRDSSPFEKEMNIDIDSTREDRALGYEIDAVDAVAYAECLKGEFDRSALDVESKVKKQISLRNRQAAISRFSGINEIKDEFVIFYESGDHVSKSDAARKFYRSLPDPKKRLFRADTVERNLLDHLRKISKK